MIENSDNFVGRMLLSSYSKTQKKTQEYIDTQRVKKTSILKLNHKELVLNDIDEDYDQDQLPMVLCEKITQ